jgi:hypothetical protein
VQAQDCSSAARLLVVVARHVLLHTLPHGLVLAGGAADHAAAHATLQQRMEALGRCLRVVQIALEGSTGNSFEHTSCATLTLLIWGFRKHTRCVEADTLPCRHMSWATQEGTFTHLVGAIGGASRQLLLHTLAQRLVLAPVLASHSRVLARHARILACTQESFSHEEQRLLVRLDDILQKRADCFDAAC